ncbi:MAG: hypothetical protein O3A14_07910 [Cyanobacteria bacterium]|nr:hypothetical protein [Cyanobacteriota bacterium]
MNARYLSTLALCSALSLGVVACGSAETTGTEDVDPCAADPCAADPCAADPCAADPCAAPE